jgi:hypothetical protein
MRTSTPNLASSKLRTEDDRRQSCTWDTLLLSTHPQTNQQANDMHASPPRHYAQGNMGTTTQRTGPDGQHAQAPDTIKWVARLLCLTANHTLAVTRRTPMRTHARTT